MTGYNDPKATGYNDPKTTGYKDPALSRPAASGGGRTAWYIAAGVVVLLALAWFFGMFSMSDDAAIAPEATQSETTTTVEPAAPAAPAN